MMAAKDTTVEPPHPPGYSKAMGTSSNNSIGLQIKKKKKNRIHDIQFLGIRHLMVPLFLACHVTTDDVRLCHMFPLNFD